MYDMNSAYDMCRIVNDYQHQQFGALAAHMSRTQTDNATQRAYVRARPPREFGNMNYVIMNLDVKAQVASDNDLETGYFASLHESLTGYGLA
jgi:hypothetical protein